MSAIHLRVDNGGRKSARPPLVLAQPVPELEVDDLSITINTPAGVLHAVSHASFRIMPGQTLCLVGESGCGKTMTALSLMRLQPTAAHVQANHIRFRGRDLQGLSEYDFADLRGNRIAMIFQDPMTALNPVYTIGNQLVEAYQRHRDTGRQAAIERAEYLLERCGISNPRARLRQYPFELSGGLRQRMMIAMALMCEPSLIIADEPTTALDVTVQAQIIHLLRGLQRELGMAMILITHDLGVVANVADQVAVMYAGQVVETGSVADIFETPLHPYTRGLLAAVPSAQERGHRLGTIGGVVPSLIGDHHGCLFRNRCSQAIPACGEDVEIPVSLISEARTVRCIRAQESITAALHVIGSVRNPSSNNPAPVILSCSTVSKSFPQRGFFKSQPPINAVENVTLDIRKGESVAIVGESGSGKTTLGRVMLGLLEPTSGTINLGGKPLSALSNEQIAQRIQPVFQDPYSSLNPRKTVRQIIAFPLQAQGIGSRAEQRERAADIAQKVGLPKRLLDSYPIQMSGGQRQRVAIARALVVQPEILILDEPTSALDVSIQAQILNLLHDLRTGLGLTYVFISHDLSVVKHMSDRIAVMYRGRIVELGATEEIFNNPQHDYTKMLFSSILEPKPAEDAMRQH